MVAQTGTSPSAWSAAAPWGAKSIQQTVGRKRGERPAQVGNLGRQPAAEEDLGNPVQVKHRVRHQPRIRLSHISGCDEACSGLENPGFLGRVPEPRDVVPTRHKLFDDRKSNERVAFLEESMYKELVLVLTSLNLSHLEASSLRGILVARACV
jgi:hypothetical protein